MAPLGSPEFDWGVALLPTGNATTAFNWNSFPTAPPTPGGSCATAADIVLGATYTYTAIAPVFPIWWKVTVPIGVARIVTIGYNAFGSGHKVIDGTCAMQNAIWTGFAPGGTQSVTPGTTTMWILYAAGGFVGNLTFTVS